MSCGRARDKYSPVQGKCKEENLESLRTKSADPLLTMVGGPRCLLQGVNEGLPFPDALEKAIGAIRRFEP